MNRTKLLSLATVAAVSATASNCFAAGTLDFTSVGTAVTAELGPAVTAAMPIAGIVLAVTLGVKLYKKFAK